MLLRANVFFDPAHTQCRGNNVEGSVAIMYGCAACAKCHVALAIIHFWIQARKKNAYLRAYRNILSNIT